MPNDLEQAHDRKFLAIDPALTTGLSHRRPGYAFKLQVGAQSFCTAYQACSQPIAGCLACDDRNSGHKWRLLILSLTDDAALGAVDKLDDPAQFRLLAGQFGNLLPRVCE